MPRRGLAAAAAVVAALALAGCTAAPSPAPPRTPTPTPTPTHEVRWASGGAATAAAATAAERALQVSRALFAASPGVVLAPDGDAAAQRDGATLAARLHVPEILVAAPVAAAASASASASASSGASSGTESAAAAEVRRLGASWAAATGGASLPGLRVVAAGRAQPAAAPEAPPVLVLAAAPDSDVAALGTAAAAGARVIDTPGSAPQSSAAAVSALAGSVSARALLVGRAFAGVDATWAAAAARTGTQYPGGGQRPFDGHRLFVALYGTPGTASLGVLGAQGPAATVARVRALAAQYRPLVHGPVVPTLEIITTVASGSPTDDHDYSSELSPGTLQPYLDAARGAHIPVLLDLQPGRTDFPTQAKAYASLLSQPGVGLALDPEWRLGPHQVPLKQIGSVSAGEVNATASWLAGLVRQHGLPPKMFVLHEFRLSMLQDRSAIDVSHPELDTLIHVDGQGTQPNKQATWRAVRAGAPHVAWGWKNFLTKDHPVLTPAQTIAQVHPTPDLVTYQ